MKRVAVVLPGTGRVARTEPRWPAIVSFVFVFALIVSLPARYETVPTWFLWTAFLAVTGSMGAVALAPARAVTHRIERICVFALVALLVPIEVRILAGLIGDMIAKTHGFASVTLLESAAMLWTMNILVFALLYWQVDRARLEMHPSPDGAGSDFAFAEFEDTKPDEIWLPSFVDYLFLAFVTSTSFTPPDYARPKSHRAKVSLMLQATLSLTTLFVIASRAIATLS